MGSFSVADYPTVALDDAASEIVLVDQTLLPGEKRVLRLSRQEDIWEAIKLLRVRGAPAIGVTAAFAVYLAAKGIGADPAGTARGASAASPDSADSCEAAKSIGADPEASADSYEAFETELRKAADYIASSRPTAVNLFWAIERMMRVVSENRPNGAGGGENHAGAPSGSAGAGSADRLGIVCKGDGGPNAQGCQISAVARVKTLLLNEANAIRDEDVRVCRSIGEHALSLLRPGMGLLTHCNAGRLATIEYGTATAAMYLGHERGYGFRIFCDETRPLLQGARLTAFELSEAGMKPTVICDNMSSALMQTGAVDAVFTGCDRVAANGDTANKIGTSLLAIAARHYGVPFYICAPTSTIDPRTPDGALIPIEQRDPSEVTDLWYEKRMAPAGAQVFNPAFDVTPAELITAIVTEHGILRPPYTDAIRALPGGAA